MNILWFRRDLRLSDNEIVTLAAAEQAEVLPCFIIDPWFYQQSNVGKARVKFLFESLENLNSNLKQRGSQLYLFEGKTVDLLQSLTRELLQQGHRPKLFFNRDVQVEYGIARDRTVLDFYRQLNLECHLGLSSFLQTEDRTDSWDEEYYTYQRQPLHQAPTQINTPQLSLNLPQLTFEELKQKYSQFWTADSGYFNGAESSAIATLDSFLSSRFHGYHWKLSRPWLAQKGATSHLSPHIAFGTISTRTIYQRTKARAAELSNQPKAEFSLKAFRVSEA
jgi:deoxyribodipyrimidine photo-lyase